MVVHNLRIKKWVRCLKTHREKRVIECNSCPHFEGEHASYIECSYSRTRQPPKCPVCKKPLHCSSCSLKLKS